MFKPLKLLITSLVGFLLLSSGSAISAAIFQPTIESQAGITIDAQTGQVIASKNDQERLPIASISKLIVIYLVEQAIKDGKLTADQPVKVSAQIASFSQDASVANVTLSTDRTYTVHELETAALLPSANGAAMALAELVAGSQNAYYQTANQLLDSWGIKDSHWVSASGLKGSYLTAFDSNQDGDAENKLSAREVAIISQKLLLDYPDILSITQQKTASFPGIDGNMTTISNTDELLGVSKYNLQGLKTGHTENNGVNFVGYAHVNGRAVITVTLNAPEKKNFSDTEAMLDSTAQLTKVTNLKPKSTITVLNAQTKKGVVNITAKKALPIFYSVSGHIPKITSKIQQTTKNQQAPIQTSTLLAKQTVTLDINDLNDYLTQKPSLTYYADKPVQKTNFLVTWYRTTFN
ncbi:D-alanyl-D-alanine carboxypeptidase [Weissella muntiaci]|uniref:D-alanyl-D-alanine carboxypeptidase n=1 Tax=Weissella muntiaci TaxID=2508881 RepID=A0A6C2CCQ5_9LACO|nr:serine hydrolase [Weissella muntiaci]TYC50985.1 D-alanyl-D-alanine carboxypeptidase [Weissella muntiaci]